MSAPAGPSNRGELLDLFAEATSRQQGTIEAAALLRDIAASLIAWADALDPDTARWDAVAAQAQAESRSA